MSSIPAVDRSPRTALFALWPLAVALTLAACNPSGPSGSSATASSAPSGSAATSATPCTSPPPSGGQVVHSAAGHFSITLAPGWTEDPTDEGSSGTGSTLALKTGGTGISSSHINFTILPGVGDPHAMIASEASSPGSGKVTGMGDCTVAGEPASWFTSTLAPLPATSEVMEIAHHGSLLRVLANLSTYGGAGMSELRSMLGSLQWDSP